MTALDAGESTVSISGVTVINITFFHYYACYYIFENFLHEVSRKWADWRLAVLCFWIVAVVQWSNATCILHTHWMLEKHVCMVYGLQFATVDYYNFIAYISSNANHFFSLQCLGNSVLFAYRARIGVCVCWATKTWYGVNVLLAVPYICRKLVVFRKFVIFVLSFSIIFFDSPFIRYRFSSSLVFIYFFFIFLVLPI